MKKGSVTVEAALVFPVLILFFASLMGLVHLAQTLMTLDGVLQASVREMAVYAYPMERIVHLDGTILEDTERILPETMRLGLARHIIESKLKSSRVSMDQIQIIAAEFPQGEERFNQRRAAGDFEGYDPAFGPEDVWLHVTYKPAWMGWALGLEGGVPLKGMERGWLKGQGRLFAPEDGESSIFQAEAQVTYVYVTRTGIRYHRGDCRYLRKSKIPMALKDAAEFYTPCRVCQPPRE
jgi:hypothetical protein